MWRLLFMTKGSEIDERNQHGRGDGVWRLAKWR